MYADFYGLSAEAFLLTPDHRFFFGSSVHSQAMAFLNYGISRGEGFIVITGDIGAGKTTMVGRLAASIDEKRIISAHVVTTHLTGTDLLRFVASAFGLTDLPDDKAMLLVRLQDFFQAAYRNRKRVLLLVDEAQNLSVDALEELRMLSNFQVGASAPFQSFLIGQPQFRTLLADPNMEQFRQRIIASYHLGALNPTECGAYVEHRLRCVGWEGDPFFDPEALRAIYDQTDGIPRMINNLCSRIMLYGFLEELHLFGKAEVDRVATDLKRERSFDALAQKSTTPQLPTVTSPDALSQDIFARIAALDRRVEVHEDFMRRLAVALQLCYSSRPKNSKSA
jgi:general secretion pathway protein A